MQQSPFKPEQLIYITATVEQLVKSHIPIGIANVLVKRPIDRIVAVVDNLVRTTRSGSYWLNPDAWSGVRVSSLPMGAAQFPEGAGQTITPLTERQIVLTPRMALTQDFLFQLLSLREQLKKNYLGLPLEGLDAISKELASKLADAIVTQHQPKKS